MPHKRAKRSVREAESAAKGFDNEPSAVDSVLNINKSKGKDGTEDIYAGVSKSLYRVLNADKIRAEKKARDTENRKRKAEVLDDHDDINPGKGKAPLKKKLKIQPGENLKSFNSRVEQAMRTDISSAIKSSKGVRKKNKLSRSAAAKQAADEEEANLLRPPPRKDASGARKDRAADFAGKEKIALNDVAMAPPSLKFGKMQTQNASARLKSLQGNATGKMASQPRKDLPVSMKQKQEMDEARKEAIAKYRAIKAQQMTEKDLS